MAVKADLAGRLIDADPARAKAEIEDIHRTARAALADVRAAVTGMRSTRLATELVTARGALDSAGITLTLQGPPQPLPPQVETTLAFVLLEGVTNVVRHALAQHCRVDFGHHGGAVTLTIQDSRATAGAALSLPAKVRALSHPPQPQPQPQPQPHEGHGISGMRQRLAAVGGTLTLCTTADGTTLQARVPLPDEVVVGALAGAATQADA